MTSLFQYSVVLPAAGIGKRMKTECPKQYLHIFGKTVIEHTINNLLEHSQVKRVIVVLNPNDKYFSQLIIANHPHFEIVMVC